MAKLPAHSLKTQWLDAAYSDGIWDVGNDWLYKLCDTYPKHTDVGEVAAQKTLHTYRWWPILFNAS